MYREKTTILLLALFLMSIWPSQVGASAPDHTAEDIWHSQCEHGDQAEIERDYPTAERSFRQALATAKQFGPTSKEMQTSIARMGTILVLQGRFEDGEPYFQQSLSLVTIMRKHGEPDPDSLVWLDDFGDAYQEMGKKLPNRQMFCLEHCVVLRNTIAPERHSKLASACNDLSKLYMNAGKFEDAERTAKLQMACIQNKYGAKAPIYMPLYNVALAQEKQKKFAQAEANLTLTISLTTKAGLSPVLVEAIKKDLARVQAENHKLKANK